MEVIRPTEWANPLGFQGGLWGFPGKPKARFMRGVDTFIQGCLVPEVGLVDGVLIPRGVAQPDLDDAVLTLLGRRDPRADRHTKSLEY